MSAPAENDVMILLAMLNREIKHRSLLRTCYPRHCVSRSSGMSSSDQSQRSCAVCKQVCVFVLVELWFSTYIYFILLLKLGCILSASHLKMNITHAQLRLAKTGHAFSCIFARTSGESICVGRGGNLELAEAGCTDSLANASITRAKTNITICKSLITVRLSLLLLTIRTCLFTLPCLPFPKTV